MAPIVAAAPSPTPTLFVNTLYMDQHKYGAAQLTPRLWALIAFAVMLVLTIMAWAGCRVLAQRRIDEITGLKKLHLPGTLARATIGNLAIISDMPLLDVEKAAARRSFVNAPPDRVPENMRRGTAEEPIIHWTDRNGKVVEVKYHSVGGWRPVEKAPDISAPFPVFPAHTPDVLPHLPIMHGQVSLPKTPKIAVHVDQQPEFGSFYRNFVPPPLSENIRTKDAAPIQALSPIFIPPKLAERVVMTVRITPGKENAPIRF